MRNETDDAVLEYVGYTHEYVDTINIYVSDMGGRYWLAWKPYLIAFAKHCKLTTIFVGNGHTPAPNKADTLFIYTIPSHIRFTTAFITQLPAQTNLTDAQNDMCMGVDMHETYNFIYVINIQDTDDDSVAFYYPVKNQVFLSNLITSNSCVDILDMIEQIVTTGFEVTMQDRQGDNYKMSAVINCVDTEPINKAVAEKVKVIAQMYDAKYKVMKNELKHAIEDINSSNRVVPEWVMQNSIRIFFIGDVLVSTKHLMICKPVSFRVTKIISGAYGNFDVRKLTTTRKVWVGFVVDATNKIREVILYKSNLLNVFTHVHRLESNYIRGYHCLCLGTFKSRLYNLKLNSLEDFNNAIGVMSEMLSTINMDDIMGHSSDMMVESRLMSKISNRNKDMEPLKFETGGWAINDENTIETDTTGGAWTTGETEEDTETRSAEDIVADIISAENRARTQRDARNARRRLLRRRHREQLEESSAVEARATAQVQEANEQFRQEQEALEQEREANEDELELDRRQDEIEADAGQANIGEVFADIEATRRENRRLAQQLTANNTTTTDSSGR